MSEPAKAIERRDQAVSESILRTGDLPLMLEQAKRNVHVAIEIARQEGFVTDYEIRNRQGTVVGTRPWFHHPTWQLIAQSWGITAFTEGEVDEVKPGTWRAAAVAQIVEDGRIVGRAVALCSRSESGKKGKQDHELAATAQTRAQRNALRSALGATIIAAAPELEDAIFDPEAPATARQKGRLHELERELGLSHAEGHARAGVKSYSDLNGQQAYELIDELVGELRERRKSAGDGEGPAVKAEPGELRTEDPLLPSPGDASGPSTPEQWKRAAEAGFTARKAVAVAKGLGFDVSTATALTFGQFEEAFAAWKKAQK